MNNGDYKSQGPEELLATIYETLKRHETLLFTLMVENQAAIAVLKERAPQFPAEFEEKRKTALAAAEFAHKQQLRLLDEIIVRIRGT